MDVLSILKELKEDVDFEQCNDFIESGVLDSFDIVNLVGELEDQFDIEIGGRDIVPENFISIESIERMLERYR